MKYKVAIRQNSTGEVRIRDMGSILWNTDAGSLYWWTDGNFGCDCNREWEFQRAKGEPISEEPECGGKKYSVLYAELEDGRKVNIDD